MRIGNSYMLLAAIQTGYSYYVEKNTIYMGKRKSLTKRVCHLPFIVSSMNGLF